MRALGRVVAVTKTGRLVVRADHAPPLGSRVYDERLTLVGEVYDIMGPVSSPYVSVKPLSKSLRLDSYMGKILYVERARLRRKRRRRGK